MTFSVVVPTYNRLPRLRRALQQLVAQEFGDYEVIVVDDGSTDGTEEFLQSLSEKGEIRFISQQNRGPSAARNAGLREARGDCVAFTDDDCLVPPDWMRKFRDAFESTGADIVGGRVSNAVEGNVYSHVSQDIINHFVQYLSRNGRSSSFLTSNNIAYRSEVIRTAGGFDERFLSAGAEERALNHKILSAGHRSAYVPEIVVEHQHEMTFRSFVRQQRNYGRGSYLLYRVAGKDLIDAPRSMPLSAYAALARGCFREEFPKGLSKLSLVLLSQLMVTVGFVTEALRSKRT